MTKIKKHHFNNNKEIKEKIMKKISIVLVSLISVLILCTINSYAQTLEINSKQSETITASGFFPLQPAAEVYRSFCI